MLSRRLLIAAAIVAPATTVKAVEPSANWQEPDVNLTLAELIERARRKVGEGELELTISVGK
jgi:hypothetical protein